MSFVIFGDAEKRSPGERGERALQGEKKEHDG
jgi:hypothetical protein